ncbi:hypothetical protein O3M35_005652 [Rhynocoris fuscipes]|uniref:Inosine/uridine-preferring nucleoside hydrolase domain-containing protein n=1 Tax=Rhynocoris fuscipes TaxID=488301 RepID=A0AAW1DRF8_9HEMI
MHFYVLLSTQIFCFLWTIPIVYSECESIIIDTDAGADDAMAILMILSSIRCVNVEAITCVRGNTGANNVSINVLKTLFIANRLDIPVFVGSEAGLVYSSKIDNYFGDDGLGDFEFPIKPDPSLLKKNHAAVAIAEIVENNPGSITIVSIGPLTNIALASHINKNFFKQVKRLIILGGSYKGQGNIGPGIEFNIYADAEAAASLFSRLPPYTPTLMLPYETCKENSYSLSWRLETLGKLGSVKMDFLNLAERKTLNNIKSWTPFDQNIAAIILHPEIILNSELGQVIVNTSDNRGETDFIVGEGSVQIVTKLNRVEVKRILIATLS